MKPPRDDDCADMETSAVEWDHYMTMRRVEGAGGAPETIAAMLIAMVKKRMMENSRSTTSVVRGRRRSQKNVGGKLVTILAQVVLVVSSAAVLALMLMPVQGAGAVVTEPSFVPQHSTGYCDLFVRSNAYKCSEIVVQTDDGYLLALQRITSPALSGSPKGPAFLYHGIMEGGEIWVMNPGQESLAFMMASAGYDVWIGNTRSSNYTYGHISYTRKDKEYWDWSWDDLVRSDLPTMLQTVHDQTNQSIYYVGYSQGTMTALAAFSQGATVNLVAKAALLSPIGSLSHITSALTIAAAWLFVDEIMLLAGVAEFSVYGKVGQQFLDLTCVSPQVDCRHELMSQITGPNCCLNITRLPFYNKYEIQSTSMRNLAHMAQWLDCKVMSISVVRSGRFCKYDYGFFGNLDKYSSLTPPEYDISAIPASLPILLAHGGNDALADPEDVNILISSLQGTPEVLNLPNYAHGDFVMGTTARSDVYTQVLKFFQA